MLIAWAFCNRGKTPSDIRFPAAALVVCPNLTIKERLQVLHPEISENYYDAFELIPPKLRPLLNSGKVLVTNWHQFAPESEHTEGGQSYDVVNKGEETPDAFAKRVLGELYERAPIMVLNDEAHHAYRPAPTDEEKLSIDARKERTEATVWIQGLDMINRACSVQFCVDLSATPFYIQGSGHPEGTPFPWLVSDFGLGGCHRERHHEDSPIARQRHDRTTPSRDSSDSGMPLRTHSRQQTEPLGHTGRDRRRSIVRRKAHSSPSPASGKNALNTLSRHPMPKRKRRQS